MTPSLHLSKVLVVIKISFGAVCFSFVCFKVQGFWLPAQQFAARCAVCLPADTLLHGADAAPKS